MHDAIRRRLHADFFAVLLLKSPITSQRVNAAPVHSSFSRLVPRRDAAGAVQPAGSRKGRWRKWVRAGRALQTMEETFQAFDQKQLAGLIGRAVVRQGELLWQSDCFCTAEKQYTRDQKTRAEVHPLGSLETRRFIGSWLTPVSDLLRSTEIKMPEPVRRELL